MHYSFILAFCHVKLYLLVYSLHVSNSSKDIWPSLFQETACKWRKLKIINEVNLQPNLIQLLSTLSHQQGMILERKLQKKHQNKTKVNIKLLKDLNIFSCNITALPTNEFCHIKKHGQDNDLPLLTKVTQDLQNVCWVKMKQSKIYI